MQVFTTYTAKKIKLLKFLFSQFSGKESPAADSILITLNSKSS